VVTSSVPGSPLVQCHPAERPACRASRRFTSRLGRVGSAAFERLRRASCHLYRRDAAQVDAGTAAQPIGDVRQVDNHRVPGHRRIGERDAAHEHAGHVARRLVMRESE